VPYVAPEINPPAAFGSPEVIAHGEEVYGRFCSTCHGSDGLSRGMFPDLRMSGTLQAAEAFNAVVIGGVLSKNGMVSFAKALQPDDAEAVRAYLVDRAIDAKARAKPAATGPHTGG